MLATELTILSTAIGDIVELVGQNQELLYSPENFMQLADRVIQQLHNYQKLDVHIPDWSENIQTMNGYLIS